MKLIELGNFRDQATGQGECKGREKSGNLPGVTCKLPLENTTHLDDFQFSVQLK